MLNLGKHKLINQGGAISNQSFLPHLTKKKFQENN